MWLLGVILASLPGSQFESCLLPRHLRMRLRGPLAAGGITEDERLLVSDGACFGSTYGDCAVRRKTRARSFLKIPSPRWHRNQRKSVSIAHPARLPGTFF